jgi:hypothetical protein
LLNLELVPLRPDPKPSRVEGCQDSRCRGWLVRPAGGSVPPGRDTVLKNVRARILYLSKVAGAETTKKEQGSMPSQSVVASSACISRLKNPIRLLSPL